MGRALDAISACYPALNSALISPYMGLNLAESLIWVKVWYVDGCFVGEDELLDSALRLTASTNLCRCVVYSWQNNRKWFVLSVKFGQFRQYGIDFEITNQLRVYDLCRLV